MIAAEHGYRELVRLLKPYQLHTRRNNGQTALMHAAAHNQTEVIQDLIDETGKVDCNGWTALMYAVWRNATSAALELFPFEVGMVTPNQECAFLCACDAGNTRLVEKLVEKEGHIAIATGETGLHLAARNGSGKIVQILSSRLGRSVTKKGQTALMYAAMDGHLPIVELLAPIEAKMQDDEGRTALLHAIRNEKEQCVCFLIDIERDLLDKKGHGPVYYAQQQSSNHIRLLVAGHLGGELDSETGDTTLIQAVKAGYIDVVEMTKDTQCGHRNQAGLYAINYAIALNHLSILSMLIPTEAKLLNRDGYNALTYAVAFGHDDAVQLLKDDVWLLDGTGHRALDYCQGLYFSPTYIMLYESLCITHPAYRAATLSFFRGLSRFVDQYSTDAASVRPLVMAIIDAVGETFFCPDFHVPVTQAIDTVLGILEETTLEVHDMQCCVCIDRPAHSVLLPCRHMCVCTECIQTLNRRCPYCQVRVESIISISFE